MDIDNLITTNWLYDYELMDEISIVSAAVNFPPPPPPPPLPASVTIDFSWASQSINGSSNASNLAFSLSSEFDCTFEDSESSKEAASGKRLRSESSSFIGSKACREKKRRDRLNERFLELGSVLEPGKPPKTNKAAILSDALRTVTHLRSEAERMKELNEDLLETIKELKAEKNELKAEKQRLKADKEKLEQQIKALTANQGFLSPQSALGVAYSTQAKASGNKLMPYIGYPGLAMWRFMQPAVIDTSQDHVLRPPVA